MRVFIILRQDPLFLNLSFRANYPRIPHLGSGTHTIKLVRRVLLNLPKVRVDKNEKLGAALLLAGVRQQTTKCIQT